MPRRSEPKKTKSLALIALHREVQEHLERWSQDTNYRVFASKFFAMLTAFRAGQVEIACILHDNIFWTRLKRDKGAKVDEYGKRQKGGAPRIFGMRLQTSYIFLAAAVEKQEDGSRAISVACSRADAIEAKVKQEKPETEAQFREILGLAYKVDSIPDDTK